MDDAEKRAIQEFAELQDQVLAQADTAGRIQQQERIIQVQRQRCILTKKELEGLPEETNMFKSIGRAYFCSPKTDVLNELDDRAAHLESDASRLKDQREALEKKMGDTESQIGELLKQSPTLARRLKAVRIE